MIIFWVLAGLLIAAALLFIVPPLLQRGGGRTRPARDKLNLTIYKDQLAELEADVRNGVLSQDQYDQGRRELERRLLEEAVAGEGQVEEQPRRDKAGVWAAAALAVFLPVAAVIGYSLMGTPAALSPEKMAAAQQEQQSSHSVTPEQIEAMVTRLMEKLQQDPNNVEGWRMLGRSMSVLGRHAEASDAYAQAVNLAPRDADLLADYADALAMASGTHSLNGKPLELIKRALESNPNNQKALWLMGTAEFDSKNYRAAMQHWEKLTAQLEPGSEEARQMAANVAEARALAEGRPLPAMPQVEAATAAAGAPADAFVAGVVKLNPALKGKVAPDDSVFIFARAAQGPPMPLAVLRKQVKDLPVTFRLDSSMSMSPALTLASFPEVVVGARVSKSGNAMRQSGDLEGMTKVIKVGSQGLEIVIDTQIP